MTLHPVDPDARLAEVAEFVPVGPQRRTSIRHENACGRLRFPLVPFETLRLAKDPAYLVKGLIPARGLTVLWGPPKCGKSFLAFDLALHVARGVDYRGRRVHGGPVVYAALEGAAGYGARADALRPRFAGEDGQIPLYLMTCRLDLVADHRALIEDISAQLTELPVLVVLDTLNRSLAGSESKDEDMAAYVRAADAIREHFGCAVVVVHHCGHDDKRPRGHSSLIGAADAQLAVKRDAAGLVRVTVEFMKDGPEGAEIVSRLVQVIVGIDEDGDTITSCVVEAVDATEAGPSPHKHKSATKLTATEKIVLQALHAVMNAAQPLEGSPHTPPPKAVTVKLWRDRASKKLGRDKPDTARRAFQRAQDGLQAKGVINVWDEHAWPSEDKKERQLP